MNRDCCLVVTTLDTKDAAVSLGRAVVQARLAACAQVVGPIASLFWWKGKVEEAEEWQCHFKTAVVRFAELRDFISEKHPYEVPELTATPIIDGNPEYLDWIRTETAPSPTTVFPRGDGGSPR